MSNVDIVVPDLLYLSHERAATVMTEKHARGVPELVVEIASPGTRRRDDGIKRHLYERAGVTEYWIVDPDVDRVRVYRRDGEPIRTRDRALARARRPADARSLLPGLEMPLVRLFRD